MCGFKTRCAPPKGRNRKLGVDEVVAVVVVKGLESDTLPPTPDASPTPFRAYLLLNDDDDEEDEAEKNPT
jgi:hypothetical protein